MSDSHSNPQWPTVDELGAVILCGGGSTRMGYEKFQLPFGEMTLLQCVIERLLPSISGPIVAVGNLANVSDVSLICDNFEHRVSTTCDSVENRGPLEGIRAGLSELVGKCDWAFVTCCDVPLLEPKILEILTSEANENCQAVIPKRGDRIYGMTALYRCDERVVDQIANRISKKLLRVSGLATALATTLVDVSELKKHDPKLRSLLNLNRPEQYFELLLEFGYACPENIAKQIGQTRLK